MRCRFCGSKSLHTDENRVNFSGKKAVVGTIVAGPIGAAAGLAGKSVKGYRCGACGQFMTSPMDFATEGAIDSAIFDAKSGKGVSNLKYLKRQYPGIIVPELDSVSAPSRVDYNSKVVERISENTTEKSEQISIKHQYRFRLYCPECPVFIRDIIIVQKNDRDFLKLIAWNNDERVIRSVYYKATVYDDTGDKLSVEECVYQDIGRHQGADLPSTTMFDLNTNLAFSVDLKCEKIAFENGDVWRASDKDRTYKIPEQPIVTKESFPGYKYLDMHYRDRNILFLPIKGKEYRMCYCGQIVFNSTTCPHCGSNLEMVEEDFSQKHLMDVKVQRIYENAKKHADEIIPYIEGLRNEEAERIEKEYAQAVNLMNSDKYVDIKAAEKILRSLPGYKDSDTRRDECEKRLTEIEQREKEEKE